MTQLPGNFETQGDRVQEAVSRRLGKLGAMPVDTSRLDRRMRSLVPPARSSFKFWSRVSAVAASLVIMGAVAFVTFSGRPVQASGDMMVQMHNDIVSGKVPTMKVESIEEANEAIAAMAANAPQLPEAPTDHAMACCMRKVGSKQVSCVLMNNGGVPVTMSVGRASDVKAPRESVRQMFNNVEYRVQKVGSLSMVMREYQEKWVCLISAGSAEELMKMADRLPR